MNTTLTRFTRAAVSFMAPLMLFFLIAAPLLAQKDQGGGGQQGGSNPPSTTFFQDTRAIFLDAGTLVNILLWVFSSLAVLMFFWGIMKYIKSAGDAKAAQEGKSIMIYGAIALFVLFSIFGIIRFLRGEFFGTGGSYGDMGSPQINF